MKEIKLTQNKVSIVDDCDFDRINKFKWYADKRGKNFYARTTIGKKNFYMHRMILSVDDKNILIDHKNRNTLDNRRGNLRNATTIQSTCNKNKRHNTSSNFIGVCWDSSRSKWMAYVNYNNRRTYLGRFENEVDAAKAYNEQAIIQQKEFANLNPII